MARITTQTPSLGIAELKREALFTGSTCEVAIKTDLGSFNITRADQGLQINIRFDTSEGSGEQVVQCDQRLLNFGKRTFFDCPKTGKLTTKLYVSGGELASAEALNLRFPSKGPGKALTVKSSNSRELITLPTGSSATPALSRQAALRNVEHSDRFADYRLSPNDFLSTETGYKCSKPEPLDIDGLRLCKYVYQKEHIDHSPPIVTVLDRLHFGGLPQVNIAALADLGVFDFEFGCTLTLSFLARFGPTHNGDRLYANVRLYLMFDLKHSTRPVMRYRMYVDLAEGVIVGEIDLIRVDRGWYFVCKRSHSPTRTLHLHPSGVLASFKALGLRTTLYQRKKPTPKGRALQAC